jgi:hypothetical protein
MAACLSSFVGTRVGFAARTQQRARRSVAVQAADRPVWLPGKPMLWFDGSQAGFSQAAGRGPHGQQGHSDGPLHCQEQPQRKLHALYRTGRPPVI